MKHPSFPLLRTILTLLMPPAMWCNAADPKVPVNPKVPILEAPAAKAVLPNGAMNQKVEMVWAFRWKPVAGAVWYEIIVSHQGSTIPLVSKKVAVTNYRHASRGYVATMNLSNWSWKVRAQVEGIWQPWSEVRPFSVQPPRR